MLGPACGGNPTPAQQPAASIANRQPPRRGTAILRDESKARTIACREHTATQLAPGSPTPRRPDVGARDDIRPGGAGRFSEICGATRQPYTTCCASVFMLYAPSSSFMLHALCSRLRALCSARVCRSTSSRWAAAMVRPWCGLRAAWPCGPRPLCAGCLLPDGGCRPLRKLNPAVRALSCALAGCDPAAGGRGACNHPAQSFTPCLRSAPHSHRAPVSACGPARSPPRATPPVLPCEIQHHISLGTPERSRATNPNEAAPAISDPLPTHVRMPCASHTVQLQ